MSSGTGDETTRRRVSHADKHTNTSSHNQHTSLLNTHNGDNMIMASLFLSCGKSPLFHIFGHYQQQVHSRYRFSLWQSHSHYFPAEPTF